MIYYFLAILALILLLIIIGIAIGINLNGRKYFKEINKDKYPEIDFFIKKHTVFRFFAIFYSILHYTLNIISATTSFITVYMIIDLA